MLLLKLLSFWKFWTGNPPSLVGHRQRYKPCCSPAVRPVIWVVFRFAKDGETSYSHTFLQHSEINDINSSTQILV